MGYIIVGIIGTILFFVFLDMMSKASINRMLSKAEKEKQRVIDSVGKFEGKTLNEIKSKLGEPSNIDVSNEERIVSWEALEIKIICTNDKNMICKEVLVNKYSNK